MQIQGIVASHFRVSCKNATGNFEGFQPNAFCVGVHIMMPVSRHVSVSLIWSDLETITKVPKYPVGRIAREARFLVADMLVPNVGPFQKDIFYYQNPGLNPRNFNV